MWVRQWRLNRALNNRERRRAVADRLGAFLERGVSLRDEIEQEKQPNDPADWVRRYGEWAGSVREYLRDNPEAGPSYGALFRDTRPQPEVEVPEKVGAWRGIDESFDSQEYWRQIIAQTNTLRGFIQEFQP
jgi:hypothetical protein